MMGRKRLVVQVGDQEVVHEFWLADIRDPCIIGLDDLLLRWGVKMDMAGAAITVGAETVALQSGRGEHGGSGGQRRNRRITDRVPRPRPCSCRLPFPGDPRHPPGSAGLCGEAEEGLRHSLQTSVPTRGQAAVPPVPGAGEGPLAPRLPLPGGASGLPGVAGPPNTMGTMCRVRGRRGRLTPQGGVVWRPRPWTPVGVDTYGGGHLWGSGALLDTKVYWGTGPTTAPGGGGAMRA